MSVSPVNCRVVANSLRNLFRFISTGAQYFPPIKTPHTKECSVSFCGLGKYALLFSPFFRFFKETWNVTVDAVLLVDH